MKITIDIKEVASQVADDLQLDEQVLEAMQDGNLPQGWSNTLLDTLAMLYNVEDEVINELVR